MAGNTYNLRGQNSICLYKFLVPSAQSRGYRRGRARVIVTGMSTTDGATASINSSSATIQGIDYELTVYNNTLNNTNDVVAELYLGGSPLSPPQIVTFPNNASATTQHLYAPAGNGSYEIRTRGNSSVASVAQIVTNGENSLSWINLAGGTNTYNSPNLEISTNNFGDGAHSYVNIVNSGNISGNITLQPTNYPIEFGIYDNFGSPVFGPNPYSAGTNTITIPSTSVTSGTYEVRITTTIPSGFDMIYVTGFNLWNNYTGSIPHEYSITQLKVTEDQLIQVADTFTFTDLLVTSSSYPDHVYINQLDAYKYDSMRNLDKNGYRFGFNTQEKDDEVYGKGNLNTAKFWEYDTRLGRRWNKDQIIKSWERRYACFGNNPIYYSDVLGLDKNHPNAPNGGTDNPRKYKSPKEAEGGDICKGDEISLPDGGTFKSSSDERSGATAPKSKPSYNEPNYGGGDNYGDCLPGAPKKPDVFVGDGGIGDGGRRKEEIPNNANIIKLCTRWLTDLFSGFKNERKFFDKVQTPKNLPEKPISTMKPEDQFNPTQEQKDLINNIAQPLLQKVNVQDINQQQDNNFSGNFIDSFVPKKDSNGNLLDGYDIVPVKPK